MPSVRLLQRDHNHVCIILFISRDERRIISVSHVVMLHFADQELRVILARRDPLLAKNVSATVPKTKTFVSSFAVFTVDRTRIVRPFFYVYSLYLPARARALHTRAFTRGCAHWSFSIASRARTSRYLCYRADRCRAVILPDRNVRLQQTRYYRP